MGIFQRKETKGTVWYVDYSVNEGNNRRRVREAVGPKKGDAVDRLAKIRAAIRENRLFDIYRIQALRVREKNIFTFSQLIFKPYLSDLHALNPQCSLGYACGPA